VSDILPAVVAFFALNLHAPSIAPALSVENHALVARLNTGTGAFSIAENPSGKADPSQYQNLG
jgi:hypothetical protein